MKIIAHRGESAYCPENSFEAFTKAIHAKADGIELDVQLTRDRKVVVIHDKWIDRIVNGTGLVSNYNWKNLKGFTQPNNERLRLLEEIIELKTFWIIDIKEKSEFLVEEVAEIMKGQDCLLFMNHGWKTEIETAKTLGLRMVLNGISSALEYYLFKKKGIEKFKGFYGIECDSKHLDLKIIELLHKEGLKASSNWSNHRLESVMKLMFLRETGIDLITTSRPALARELLREGSNNGYKDGYSG